MFSCLLHCFKKRENMNMKSKYIIKNQLHLSGFMDIKINTLNHTKEYNFRFSIPHDYSMFYYPFVMLMSLYNRTDRYHLKLNRYSTGIYFFINMILRLDISKINYLDLENLKLHYESFDHITTDEYIDFLDNNLYKNLINNIVIYTTEFNIINISYKKTGEKILVRFSYEPNDVNARVNNKIDQIHRLVIKSLMKYWIKHISHAYTSLNTNQTINFDYDCYIYIGYSLNLQIFYLSFNFHITRSSFVLDNKEKKFYVFVRFYYRDKKLEILYINSQDNKILLHKKIKTKVLDQIKNILSSMFEHVWIDKENHLKEK